jgi:DNA-directed RNA polymerase subunit K/omega
MYIPLTMSKSKVSKSDVDESDNENLIEITAEEDEFFGQKNFTSPYQTNKVHFHDFDPETYENELRRHVTILPKHLRRTSEVISKWEFTDIVSNRARQIEKGSIIFIDIAGIDDPITMAEMECRQKKCPLSVVRHLSDNIAEVWEVNEMTIPY